MFFFQGRGASGTTARARLERSGDGYVVHTIYDKGTRHLRRLVWSGRPSSLNPEGSAPGLSYQQATTTDGPLDGPVPGSPLAAGGTPVNPSGARSDHGGQTNGVNFTQRRGEGKGPRGAFSRETNTIALLKNASLSTFRHESGHFFLEV